MIVNCDGLLGLEIEEATDAILDLDFTSVVNTTVIYVSKTFTLAQFEAKVNEMIKHIDRPKMVIKEDKFFGPDEIATLMKWLDLIHANKKKHFLIIGH